MSYKVILLHIDQSRHCASRIELAASIAMEEGAHLIGLATTGIARFRHDTVAVNPEAPSIAPYLAMLREQAQTVRDHFERTVDNLGVTSFESRAADEDALEAINQQARYCDLSIVGKYDSDEYGGNTHAELAAHVALQGSGPVLIAPPVGHFRAIPKNIMIAWDQGTEARRAVQGAMPLLRRAENIELVVVNPSSREPRPEHDIALYLSRHGIAVEIAEQHTSGDIGRTLLDFASDRQMDLLVMGCYGHARVRELLLGGVTRTVLSEMTLPVLMAH